jgi:hypothetical protein
MLLWKPPFSHYPAIKPTPENARILLLAPTAIIGCARITSAAADFNIAAQRSRWHRDDGPNRIILLMAAPGGRLQYWSPKHLFSASCFNHVWEVAAVFGRVEVSRNVVVYWFDCAWNCNSPIYPSHLQRQASILKPAPATPHRRLSNRKAKPLHLFGL